jgi:hypothetical protein
MENTENPTNFRLQIDSIQRRFLESRVLGKNDRMFPKSPFSGRLA